MESFLKTGWIRLISFSFILTLFFGMTAFAATWRTGAQPNQNRWWYDYEDGTYAANGWQWIDGNSDGTAECYYFDGEGWMAQGETTPDGYEVNENGAWVENGTVQTKTVQPENHGNILVAYFSRTGTTEAAAQRVAKASGGTLYEIQPEVPYPSNYSETVSRSRQERSTGTLPALAGDVDQFDSYSVVFIGYPIWSNDTPMVMKSFLNSHDWSGKTVIPFCTSGGSGITGSMNSIRQYCSAASIRSGRDLTGEDEAAVTSWVQEVLK